jgi:sulfite exporter TauE/SafE
MMQLSWAAFVLGLAGSIHCLLMCGPLITSASSKKYGLPGTVLYQGGRIFSYLVIGLVFGLIGKVLSLLFYQQLLSIISGVLLLFWAFFYFFPATLKLSTGILKLWSHTTSGLFTRLWRKSGILSVLGLGALNGFLPCGLVYLAASASISQGSILYSVGFMFLFGLGTLPAILVLIFSKSMLPSKWSFPVKKLTPYLLILLGSTFILRGLDLNIPYLSPHIVQVQTGHKAVTSQCCEKPLPQP